MGIFEAILLHGSHIPWSTTSERLSGPKHRRWEDEGGAAPALVGNAEFDRVAESFRTIAGKEGDDKRTDTEAIIAILENRRAGLVTRPAEPPTWDERAPEQKANVSNGIPDAGATAENENSPTRHHQVQTTLEERSIESSFFTFSPFRGRADQGPQLESIRAQCGSQVRGSWQVPH
jgi:hypothetical protein